MLSVRTIRVTSDTWHLAHSTAPSPVAVAVYFPGIVSKVGIQVLDSQQGKFVSNT